MLEEEDLQSVNLLISPPKGADTDDDDSTTGTVDPTGDYGKYSHSSWNTSSRLKKSSQSSMKSATADTVKSLLYSPATQTLNALSQSQQAANLEYDLSQLEYDVVSTLVATSKGNKQSPREKKEEWLKELEEEEKKKKKNAAAVKAKTSSISTTTMSIGEKRITEQSKKKTPSRIIERIYMKTGKVVATYKTLDDAVKSTKVSRTVIYNLLEGTYKAKSYKGYTFRYNSPDDEHHTEADSVNSSGIKPSEHRNYRIQQIKVSTGECVGTFSSYTAAAENARVDRKFVSAIVNGKGGIDSYQGWTFRYEDPKDNKYNDALNDKKSNIVNKNSIHNKAIADKDRSRKRKVDTTPDDEEEVEVPVKKVQKVSKYRRSGGKAPIPILEINAKTGKVIRRHASMMQAASHHKVSRHAIYNVLNGQKTEWNGIIWEYGTKDDGNYEEYTTDDITPEKDYEEMVENVKSSSSTNTTKQTSTIVATKKTKKKSKVRVALKDTTTQKAVALKDTTAQKSTARKKDSTQKTIAIKESTTQKVIANKDSTQKSIANKDLTQKTTSVESTPMTVTSMRSGGKTPIPVIEVDAVTGKTIRRHDSMMKAATHAKVSRHVIYDVLSGSKPSFNGIVWKYFKDDISAVRKPKKKSRLISTTGTSKQQSVDHSPWKIRRVADSPSGKLFHQSNKQIQTEEKGGDLSPDSSISSIDTGALSLSQNKPQTEEITHHRNDNALAISKETFTHKNENKSKDIINNSTIAALELTCTTNYVVQEITIHDEGKFGLDIQGAIPPESLIKYLEGQFVLQPSAKSNGDFVQVRGLKINCIAADAGIRLDDWLFLEDQQTGSSKSETKRTIKTEYREVCNLAKESGRPITFIVAREIQGDVPSVSKAGPVSTGNSTSVVAGSNKNAHEISKYQKPDKTTEVITSCINKQEITIDKLNTSAIRKERKETEKTNVAMEEKTSCINEVQKVIDRSNRKRKELEETSKTQESVVNKKKSSVKTKYSKDKKAVKDSNVVPFCAACNGRRQKRPFHHAWCPKNSFFLESGADEKLKRIQHGISIGCSACSEEYQTGCSKKKMLHSKKCKQRNFASPKNDCSNKPLDRDSVSPSSCPSLLGDNDDESVYQNPRNQSFQKLVLVKNSNTEANNPCNKDTVSSKAAESRLSKDLAKRKTESSLVSKENLHSNKQGVNHDAEARNMVNSNGQANYKGSGRRPSEHENAISFRKSMEMNQIAIETTDQLDKTWKECENKWGDDGHDDDDIALFSTFSQRPHHEVLILNERFEFHPFRVSSPYRKTHVSPEEGFQTIVLRRDVLAKRPWGFTWKRHEFGGACLVSDVQPLSPADAATLLGVDEYGDARAPLRTNDLLVAINGKAIGGMTVAGFEIELELIGPQMILTVSRHKMQSDMQQKVKPTRGLASGDAEYNCWNDSHHRLDWVDTDNITYSDKGREGKSGTFVPKQNSNRFLIDERSPPPPGAAFVDTDQETSAEIKTLKFLDNPVSPSKQVSKSISNQRVDATQSQNFKSSDQIPDKDLACLPSKFVTNGESSRKTRERKRLSGTPKIAKQTSSEKYDNGSPAESADTDDGNAWCGCLCGVTHDKDVEVFWIQCETCQTWYNCSEACIGLSAKEAGLIPVWTCWGCSPESEPEPEFASEEENNEMSSPVLGKDQKQSTATAESLILQSTAESAKDGLDGDNDGIRANEPKVEHSESSIFAKNDIVLIKEHSWPGVNNPEGIAKVLKAYTDDDGDQLYDIKYIIGGKRRGVFAKYVVKHVFK